MDIARIIERGGNIEKIVCQFISFWSLFCGRAIAIEGRIRAPRTPSAPTARNPGV